MKTNLPGLNKVCFCEEPFAKEMVRLKTKEDMNILPEFSSSNKTSRKRHVESEYSITACNPSLKVKEYPNLMHINGIVMRSTQKNDFNFENSCSDKNLYDNLACDPQSKNAFGKMEDPEDKIIDKIDYASHKYLEFKQKMRYFKERQNKEKFKIYMRKLGTNNGFTMNIDDYNEEDKILGIDKICDISPYQKAVIKEEARRKFQMMQK